MSVKERNMRDNIYESVVCRVLILSATMSATVDLKKGEPLTSYETSHCLALHNSLPSKPTTQTCTTSTSVPGLEPHSGKA